MQKYLFILKLYPRYLKSLKHDMLEELPFLTELLGDMNIQLTALNEEPQKPEASNSQQDADVTRVPGVPEPASPSLSIMPLRVIIHGHHPDTNTTEGDTVGKLIHLSASIEDLFKLAGIRVSNDKAYISLPRRPGTQ
ncbi:hypothetical protein Q3G72_034676 [Acer saccharum]|nr:hypothetical protein Q3G72_034676 [Acer saccharum]